MPYQDEMALSEMEPFEGRWGETRCLFTHSLSIILARAFLCSMGIPVSFPAHGLITTQTIDESGFEAECRCGGHYYLTKEDIESGCDVVPCDTCSLGVRILL